MSTSRGQHLVGKELGSCILEKLLGYGGSSAVFLARQISSQDEVAVKVFLPRLNTNAQMQKSFYARFLREAEAASELDHPHILTVYSYGEEDGLPYIIMPYMPGGTLSEYILKHGPLSLSEAQCYLEQIASALDYAHEHGCVHCDVKPANILLDSEGNAVLSDFGIAHLMQPDMVSPQPAIRSSDTLMGTPDYLSPEQALGQELDGRSDIYSLGITLYFLLAGHPPFKAEDSIAMALMHVHETPPPLGLIRADVTPLIDQVLGKSLAKWPENRYQTAGEFASAYMEVVALASNITSPDFKNKSAGNALNDTLVPASGDRNAEPAAQASITVKRIQQPRPRLSTKALLILLLLATLVGSVLTFIVAISLTNKHFSTPTPATRTPIAKVKATPTSPANLLNDKEAWDSDNFTCSVNGSCDIKSVSKKYAVVALYYKTTYTNFHLTVTMTPLHYASKGDYYGYGVVFRSTPSVYDEAQARYYVFEVSTAEGKYFRFLRNDGNTKWKEIASGPAPSLLANLAQKNVITVDTVGNTFAFSINGKPIITISDPVKPALISGEIGLYVEGQGTEVTFSNLQVQRVS